MQQTAPSAGPTVVIASIQFQPHFGAVDSNLDSIERLIRSAAGQSANLIVLPELADSGYMFESSAELSEIADTVPAGKSARLLIRLGKELGVYIVCGLAERDGDQYFNTALLCGPDGYIGKYRKLHLWNREHLVFQPGNLGLPVFDTAIGRIGLAICYDGWFPETFRVLALKGAQLVGVPTNWVPMAGQAPGDEPIANTLLKAAAHSNGIYIAAADRIGTERNQLFIGHSLIVGANGLPLAGPASPHEEDIILATATLGLVESFRTLNPYNNVLGDRREDVYGADPVQSANKQ